MIAEFFQDSNVQCVFTSFGTAHKFKIHRMANTKQPSSEFDVAAINKMYKGSWCDYPDWQSWKNSKIELEAVQLPLACLKQGNNSRQLRYVSFTSTGLNQINDIHVFRGCFNYRNSGINTIKESIQQSGWDNALSKFIVFPDAKCYKKFKQCLPDAKEVFTSWVDRQQKRDGMLQLLKSKYITDTRKSMSEAFVCVYVLGRGGIQRSCSQSPKYAVVG